MKKRICLFVFTLISCVINAQTGIGTKAPDASSALDVNFTDKGILIPRVSLTGTTDITTITSAAKSLMVYNIATISDITPGYYYWDNNRWNRLLTTEDNASSGSWLDNATEKPAMINTNNIYQMGNVGIGTKALVKGVKLEVLGAVRMGGNHTGKVGVESMALGFGNTASGDYSISLGVNNVASGIGSGVSSGYLNNATGTNAMIGGGQYNNATNIETTIGGGRSNYALGLGATVSGGIENSAYSYGEWTGGLYGKKYIADGPSKWFANDRIFSVGNGQSENYRSNALTILKNGNTGFGNTATLPTERVDIGSGNLRIRDINSVAGAQTDKIVVADPTGILKTTDLKLNDGWNLSGNSGTIPGQDFIGTTDNKNLVFKVANTPAGLLSYANTYNTSFGVNSYKGTPTGSSQGRWNTAIGYNSLHGSTDGIVNGHDNVAVGSNSLSANNLGQQNVAIGSEALKLNSNGSQNSAIGFKSLQLNSSGNNNVAHGASTLLYNNVGANNTAIGTNALSSNTSGKNNTAVGFESISKNNTGSDNTAIGNNSGPTVSNVSNSTAIGNGATVGESNTIQLGNTAVTAISGQVPFTTTSDRRYKENIQSISLGLDFVNKLHPVEYIRKNNEFKTKEWGVIAQELQQSLQEVDYINAGIVQQDNSKDKMLSVRYTDLIAPIIKAIQELTVQNKKLEKNNKLQTDKIDQLLLELKEIKSRIGQNEEFNK